MPIDTSLFFKLVRVVNLTARPFTESLSRMHQLSLNEWRAMVVLASHPGMAATEVVDATGLDKMSVSRAIAALARRGRLLREGDPADARRRRLTLSAAGLALYRRIGASAVQREARLFGAPGGPGAPATPGAISAAEQARISRTLDRLIEALGESQAEPPSSRHMPTRARRSGRAPPRARSKAEQT